MKLDIFRIMLMLFAFMFAFESAYANSTKIKVLKYQKRIKEIYGPKVRKQLPNRDYINFLIKKPQDASKMSFKQMQDKYPNLPDFYSLLQRTTRAYFGEIDMDKIINNAGDLRYINLTFSILKTGIPSDTLLYWWVIGIKYFQHKDPNRSRHDYYALQGMYELAVRIVYNRLDKSNKFSLKQLDGILKKSDSLVNLFKKWPVTRKIKIGNKTETFTIGSVKLFKDNNYLFSRVISNDKVKEKYMVLLYNSLIQQKNKIENSLAVLKQRINKEKHNTRYKQDRALLNLYRINKKKFRKLFGLKGRFLNNKHPTKLKYLHKLLVNNSKSLNYPSQYKGDGYDSDQLLVSHAIGAVNYLFKNWVVMQNEGNKED